MRKFVSYLLTPLYYLVFGLLLVIFHPVQWFCLKVWGYNSHKNSVDYLNFCLTKCLLLLGNRVKFEWETEIPKGRPAIIVANHQSMNDIPPMIWYMRKLHPKFISKKELAHGIPSVSFNLRHGGSALIDRKNPEQAIREIERIAAYAMEHQRAVVIFPEGTRSRTGEMKKFHRSGLKTLIRKMPGAMIIPVSINQSWKTLEYGKYPLGIGHRITLKTHPPLHSSPDQADALIDQTEAIIRASVHP